MTDDDGWIVLHQTDAGITRARRLNNVRALQIIDLNADRHVTLQVFDDGEAAQLIAALRNVWLLG